MDNRSLLKMLFRHELCLEEKINSINEKERGLSYRELSDMFDSNLLKKRSICDYFKYISTVPARDPMK